MYQIVDCSHLKKIKKSQFTCLDAATIDMEEIECNQSSCLENEALNLYRRCLCVSENMVERGGKRSFEKSRQIIIIILGMSFRIFFNYTGAVRFSILVSLIPMYYIFFFFSWNYKGTVKLLTLDWSRDVCRKKGGVRKGRERLF